MARWHWSVDRVIDGVIEHHGLQMLVKQKEIQRQIQNAETEKQLQQALSQVTDISKALEEIRLCYQSQVSVSVYLRMITWSRDDYMGDKLFTQAHDVKQSPVLYIMCKKKNITIIAFVLIIPYLNNY